MSQTAMREMKRRSWFSCGYANESRDLDEDANRSLDNVAIGIKSRYYIMDPNGKREIAAVYQKSLFTSRTRVGVTMFLSSIQTTFVN